MEKTGHFEGRLNGSNAIAYFVASEDLRGGGRDQGDQIYMQFCDQIWFVNNQL